MKTSRWRCATVANQRRARERPGQGNWASAFGHCAGGRDNIVREQRQERGLAHEPAAAREELPAKPSSEPPLGAAGCRQRINRHDRTDRI